MELKVKLTFDDYKKYYQRRAGRIVLVALVIFACLVFYYSRQYGAFDIRVYTIAAVICIAIILIEWAMMNSRIKKHYENDKLIQEEQTYVLDEKGFKISSQFGASDVPWDKMYGAMLNKKFISINPSKTRAYLLPARFFRDKSQMQELADLLNKVLPKGRVKGKI